MSSSQVTIAVVAIEISGDMLAAGLMQAIKKQLPTVNFIGVGGKQMQKHGLESLVPLDSVAIMGVTEVLKAYRGLKKIHSYIVNNFLKAKPDLFIGIDGPDFNMRIASQLKDKGIKTAQYISPKIWASRPKRAYKIKQIYNLVLCLFPFEVEFYRPYGVNALYVGHPMADEIQFNPSQDKARQVLNLSLNDNVVTILPGSRKSEIKYLAPTLIETMQEFYEQDSSAQFIISMASQELYQQFTRYLECQKNKLPIIFTESNARTAIAAADVVIVKSGTGALETLLVGRPMIVVYRLSKISYWVIKKLINVKYISLPNLLYNDQLVPEFIQNQVNSKLIRDETQRLLESSNQRLMHNFELIRHALRRDSHQKSAIAIIDLL